MEVFNIDDFKDGWFIGNFKPSILHTPEFEISIKHFAKGEIEVLHYQERSTEYTIVIFGRIKLCGQIFVPKNIVVIYPNEECSFEALDDSTLVCIKTPSIPSDKKISKLK